MQNFIPFLKTSLLLWSDISLRKWKQEKGQSARGDVILDGALRGGFRWNYLWVLNQFKGSCREVSPEGGVLGRERMLPPQTSPRWPSPDRQRLPAPLPVDSWAQLLGARAGSGARCGQPPKGLRGSVFLLSRPWVGPAVQGCPNNFPRPLWEGV